MKFSRCRIVFIIVCGFIFIATLYDAALRYKILRGTDKKDISNNIVTESKLMTANGKLDRPVTLLRLWTVTTHNGSLGIVFYTYNSFLTLFYTLAPKIKISKISKSANKVVNCFISFASVVALVLRQLLKLGKI